MESAEEQLQRCIEFLHGASDNRTVGELLWPDVPSLLENESIAESLVARVAALDETAIDAEVAEKGLLEYLLDEARRAREDGRPAGGRFIEAAGATLESLDPGSISDAGIVGLGSAYHRAGLEVPAPVRSLQASRLTAEQPADTDDPAALAASLADSIAQMRDQCDDHPFSVYTMLADSMAALPDEGCEALIHEMTRWDGPFWQQLCAYWLFDPRPALRRAAAAAIKAVADSGQLADEVAARLTWIRALLPHGEALNDVDGAIAAYRKRQRGWPDVETTGAIDQAHVSIPDGVGAQYLVLGQESARGYSWAVVLVKSGYGIRDAYILGELDEAAEEDLWSTLADAADLRPVSRAIVMAVLGAALAENLANGEAPAPGLIDVAGTCGLTDLRPQPTSGRDWLREIDPGQWLAKMTPQKRGRLINQSARWHEHLAVLASWFEDNADVIAILERGESEKRRDRALRDHLDTRREWWAELCLRGALIVQQDDAEGLTFTMAATGIALLDGRDLKRIPLMESIIETTIAAHEQGPLPNDPATATGGSRLSEVAAGVEDELPQLGVTVDPARMRLQPLFDDGPAVRQRIGGYFGLYGYLFAVATHPEPIEPTHWLEPVFDALHSDGAGPDDQAGVQSLLNDLINVYNTINEQVIEMQPALPEGCAMRSEPGDNLAPDASLRQWALGFSRAREHFGHLTDTSFDDADDSDQLNESIQIATEMIEFLGDPDAAANRDASSDESLRHLAVMACEYFGENLQLLCAARMTLQTDAGRKTHPTADAEPDTKPVTPQAILAWLDEPDISYQWGAMNHAVAQASALTPLLLQRLEEVVEDPRAWLDRDSAGLLYTMALLAHFREPAAHELVLQLAALPGDVQEPLLGDATTEFLPVVLWRTSGGETAGLKRLLEDRTAYDFGRGAGAQALAYGVLFGQLNRTEINAYLASLLEDETLGAPEESIWFGVLDALLDLYPEEHETAIREFLRYENPDPYGVRESDLDRVLTDDREVVLEQNRQHAVRRFPDDVHGYLSHWAGFQPMDPDRIRQDHDPSLDPYADEYGAGSPSTPGSGGATKPKGPSPDKKKKKRKQQKKARKTNRKRR